MKVKWQKFKEQNGKFALPAIVIVGIIVVIVASFFIPSVNTIFTGQNLSSAINLLENNGYIVFAAGEYAALYDLTDQIFEHQHATQLVAPLDAPTNLASGAGAYNLGNYSSDILGVGDTTGRFDIIAIGFGTPDTNGTYTVILYKNDPGVQIGQVSFNRQGVFTASIYRDMATEQLPAGTRIRAKMMDSTGGATCVTKIYYHYH